MIPREPYNLFISGDCDDQAYVWKIVKDIAPTTEAKVTSTEGQATESAT
jgi:hypothetical protein